MIRSYTILPIRPPLLDPLLHVANTQSTVQSHISQNHTQKGLQLPVLKSYADPDNAGHSPFDCSLRTQIYRLFNQAFVCWTSSLLDLKNANPRETSAEKKVEAAFWEGRERKADITQLGSSVCAVGTDQSRGELPPHPHGIWQKGIKGLTDLHGVSNYT